MAKPYDPTTAEQVQQIERRIIASTVRRARRDVGTVGGRRLSRSEDVDVHASPGLGLGWEPSNAAKHRSFECRRNAADQRNFECGRKARPSRLVPVSSAEAADALDSGGPV